MSVEFFIKCHHARTHEQYLGEFVFPLNPISLVTLYYKYSLFLILRSIGTTGGEGPLVKK